MYNLGWIASLKIESLEGHYQCTVILGMEEVECTVILGMDEVECTVIRGMEEVG